MNEIKAIDLYLNRPYIKENILKTGDKVIVNLNNTIFLEGLVKERSVEVLVSLGIRSQKSMQFLSIDVDSQFPIGTNIETICPIDKWIIIY